MKQCLIYLFLFVLLFSLCACESSGGIRPGDMMRPVSEETDTASLSTDISAADDRIIAAARGYSRTVLENPRSYFLEDALQRTTYTDGTYLYVHASSFAGDEGYLVYDKTGALVKELRYPTPYPEILASGVWILSDGTIFYYGSDGRNTGASAVFICDMDGTILKKTTLTNFDGVSMCSTTDIHVSEYEDGRRRILIAEPEKIYYLDEELQILETVKTNIDYDGIYKKAEDLYVLGDSVAQIAWVDMKIGYLEKIDDLGLPEGWADTCYSLQYGGDGALYCMQADSLYQCDEAGGAKEILRFGKGIYNAYGIYWVVDETAIFFVPLDKTLPTDYRQLCLLTPMDAEPFDFREDLTLAVLSTQNYEWLKLVTALFNAENEQYRAELLDFRHHAKGEGLAEPFNAYLLENDVPDMVLYQRKYDALDLVDKGLFDDLSASFGDKLLGCARSAYTEADGAQYLIPLSMEARLFAAASDVQDKPLTWDMLGEMMDAVLGDTSGTAAVTSDNDTDILKDHSLFEFYDVDQQRSQFDTEAFRERVRLLEALRVSGSREQMYGKLIHKHRYELTGSGIVGAVRSGAVRLLYVPFHSMKAYTALKRIFDDTPFTLCGYPTVEGISPSVSVYSNNLIGVFADSIMKEGCDTFISYLLSDAIQSDSVLTENALPVTRSALEKALEDYRYTYYPTMTSALDLEPFDHNAYPKPSYLTFGYYSEMVLSDAECDAILDFFSHCISRADPDPTIERIVDEELSAYTAGAKSLEETTRLIDSRVQIYLYE